MLRRAAGTAMVVVEVRDSERSSALQRREMRRQVTARALSRVTCGPQMRQLSPNASPFTLCAVRRDVPPQIPRGSYAVDQAAQMAGTKFAYVKNFELPDPLLPGTYILLRLDGHGFHRYVPPYAVFRVRTRIDGTRLSQDHDFVKPNDERALQLMDHAARGVMNEFKDIVLAFGESDEYRYAG